MAPNHKGPYEILSTRDVYRNPWIAVREDRVVRPGGAEGFFGVVEMKEGATVLALDPHQDVHLVREFKYAVERDSLGTHERGPGR